tara:strand:+ start:1172 stop:1363 length:192 start_codon:yes stop_codon:yes gene_type:complete
VSIRQPKFIKDWLEIYRNGGLVHLLKVKGFVVVIAFFLFYLIRDSIFYILIPYLAYSNFSACG